MSTPSWQNRWLKRGILLAIPLALLFILTRLLSWRPQTLQGLGGAVTAIAYAPDGRLYCATDNSFVQVWRPDLQRWRSYLRPTSYSGSIASTFLHFYAAENSLGGARLIAGGSPMLGAYGSSPNIVWDADTRKPLFFAGYSNGGGLAISADNKTLATAGRDEVYLYDLTAKPELPPRPRGYEGHLPLLLKPKTLLGAKPGFLISLAFSPDGKMLAGNGGRSFPIIVWELPSRKIIKQFTADPMFAATKNVLGSQSFRDTSLVFSPDSKSLIRNTSSGAVERWDIATGQPAARIPEARNTHSLTMSCQVGFSPDGEILATSDGAGIVLRDPQTLREIRRFNIGGPFAFSPDGKTLATGRDNAHEISFWRIH